MRSAMRRTGVKPQRSAANWMAMNTAAATPSQTTMSCRKADN